MHASARFCPARRGSSTAESSTSRPPTESEVVLCLCGNYSTCRPSLVSVSLGWASFGIDGDGTRNLPPTVPVNLEAVRV